MDLQMILTICSVTACIFSILALILGFTALLKVMSMEKATHSVHFQPVNQEWASTDEEIKEINEEFKEENDEIIAF